MGKMKDQIIELVAKNRHAEMIVMGIDTVPWEDKPADYRKKLIKAERKRQDILNEAIGINLEPIVIVGDDKPKKKKGKKSK